MTYRFTLSINQEYERKLAVYEMAMETRKKQEDAELRRQIHELRLATERKQRDIVQLRKYMKQYKKDRTSRQSRESLRVVEQVILTLDLSILIVNESIYLSQRNVNTRRTRSNSNSSFEMQRTSSKHPRSWSIRRPLSDKAAATAAAVAA